MAQLVDDGRIPVAYLPGLAMRRIADLYPGEAKTDARDAYVIADADLAQEATRLTNRLHDALLHVHPALERLPGKQFRRRGVLQLLAATGTPAAIAALGPAKIKRLIATGSPQMAATLPTQVLAAVAEQTVTIPATEQYGKVIRGLAAQLLSMLEQRDTLAADLDALLATHPLAEILTSMPGVGSRTAIELLRTVGDGSTFPTARHVAAYVGLAPTTRQSGRTIKGEHQARRGNRSLRGAL